VWKPGLDATGIPTTRANGCHALRHFYASVLLDGGESIKVVSERLGHADPAFTLRTYTHLMPDSANRTRTVVDAAFAQLAAQPSSPRATDVPQAGR
jgi:integrase